MTSEERWIKIENTLQTITEHQADFHAEMAEMRKEFRRRVDEHDREIAEIRNLEKGFVIGLAERDKQIDEKLNRLSDNIDKWLRGRGPNGHETK
jgi:hypothetical protein